MKNAVKTILLACLLPLACKAVELRAPDGYVVYSDLKGTDYRALSAEGIAIRVKTSPNEPASDPELWAKSLMLNLESRGYILRGKPEAIVTSGGLKGILVKSSVRSENQDFGYDCAVFTSGSEIYFVEAAGAYPEFAAHESKIIEAMRTFKLKPGL